MIRRVVRADGDRFQVYCPRDGRKVYVGTYDSRRAAKEAEEDFRATQRKIERGELPPALDEKRTLKAATDEWLKALLVRRSRSHRAYSEFLRYQILPELAGVPIARINKSMLMQWRDKIATRYAPTSVNSSMACLSAAFAYFVDRQWVPSNPCYAVRYLEVPPRAYNWIKTRAELERLLSVCPDELRDMIAVAVGTGLRLDELLHLAWDDVDLGSRLLTIQRGRQGTVKGGRVRHVPILDSVLPIFQHRALRRDGVMLVFPGKAFAAGKQGTSDVRAKTPVQVAFKHALRRAGLDVKLRWHDLRHTCASWWVLSGGDIFRLSKLLGHSNVSITQKTYAHLAPEAWQQDYHRLSFHCPTEPAKVYEVCFDERGKLAGKRALASLGPVVRGEPQEAIGSR